MTKLGHGPGFTQKAIGYVAVGSKLSLDDLYGNGTFQSQVGRSIDCAHPTGSDLTFDTKPTGYELRDIHDLTFFRDKRSPGGLPEGGSNRAAFEDIVFLLELSERDRPGRDDGG
jgi:hypothetical protein